MHWIIKETAGAILLLGAIIYLPVIFSNYWAPKSIPFRPDVSRQSMIKVFPSDPETRQNIVRSLSAQLKALRRGAFEEAYRSSSQGIRHAIPLSEFERMVRIRFEPMLQFEAIEISKVFDDGKQGVIQVRLSRDGIPTAIYSYIMMLEGKEWRVGGVLPERVNVDDNISSLQNTP
ncbi:DUF4864 domain-containing protein [Verrucomicrobia bacterium]|nr:DUF4864 domain-containing protein [Verrucomicrobiota bacterium]MDB4665101.1 DUF4864 domain-containing protein [Verrucomicrobiota bacterium]MDG1891549.1 DUF4864 domain-containing protein [Verrucomicrobiota bacterium]